jgi:predicted small lipoprotein YifL
MKSLLSGLCLLALFASLGGCGGPDGPPPTETPVKKERLPPKK